MPSELLGILRLRRQTLATREGAIAFDTRRLGPCLFVQASPSPDGRLSARVIQIARLYAHGRSHRQIATGLQPVTVRNFLQRVYRKLRVRNKPELVQALRGQPMKWSSRRRRPPQSDRGGDHGQAAGADPVTSDVIQALKYLVAWA